jgi:hypothetical protein
MAPEFDLIRTYRDWLARGLYGWLEWRAAQAEDCPADRRYVQAAKALYLAARDVMALPDDDPRLLRLAHFCDAGDGAVREFLEQECRIIARHGFDSAGTQTTGGLLSALVKAADDAVLLSLENALSS